MRTLQAAANTWDSHMIELAACRDVFATACKISTTIGPSSRVQPHGRKNVTKEMIHLVPDAWEMVAPWRGVYTDSGGGMK